MIGKETREFGTVYLVYKGDGFGDLVPNEFYTYQQYAKAANVSQNCMQSRLGSREYVTDWDLRERRQTSAQQLQSPWLVFESYTDYISSKWLRKKL